MGAIEMIIRSRGDKASLHIVGPPRRGDIERHLVQNVDSMYKLTCEGSALARCNGDEAIFRKKLRSYKYTSLLKPEITLSDRYHVSTQCKTMTQILETLAKKLTF